MEYKVQVIRSKRKSISLEIKPDLSIIMRVPNRMSAQEIERFLKDKEAWIGKHLQQMKNRQIVRESKPKQPSLSAEDIQNLAQQALERIPQRVQYYAPLVGVTYGRVTIRNQKTRWGSCSSKGNLNFNCLLMLTPPEVLDYVVVHELCHRIEMNHSADFWAQVQRVYPEYRQARKWLKENGNDLIERML